MWGFRSGALVGVAEHQPDFLHLGCGVVGRLALAGVLVVRPPAGAAAMLSTCADRCRHHHHRQTTHATSTPRLALTPAPMRVGSRCRCAHQERQGDGQIPALGCAENGGTC